MSTTPYPPPQNYEGYPMGSPQGGQPPPYGFAPPPQQAQVQGQPQVQVQPQAQPQHGTFSSAEVTSYFVLS